MMIDENSPCSSPSGSEGPWQVRVPDFHYWREQIRCQNACPVRTDARGYVRAIAEGEDERAYLIARGPNPLASICGRVCGAPCEAACRRGDVDQPIAIRALKGYVCRQFGPESSPGAAKSLLAFLKESASGWEEVSSGRDTLVPRLVPRLVPHSPRQCQDRDELLPMLQALMSGRVPKAEGQSVGIIGSGPAGLAAAHDLALLGFRVTIYEMEPMLGGMLAVGVPEYRLPRAVIQAETEVIAAMGVEAATNCCVGRDLPFPEIRQRHDAVIIAVGAKRSRALTVPGSDGPGVLGGVEFLRDVSIGNPPSLGRRVVVIGGGNVAYDVGRSVLRQISIDAARTARRSPDVAEVHLCSLESLEEMPADDIEIIEGDEEGIIRRNSLGPKEILRDAEGRVTGVRFQRCLRVFDEQKRFSPLFDENDITDIPCDQVLIAIGQSYDIAFIDAGRDGLAMTERGLIACDPETGATSAPDVFVAGDLAYGPKLLIHAVASGKAVARAVYERLTGRPIAAEEVELHFPLPDYAREEGYEKVPRHDPPTLAAAERIQQADAVVEKTYPPETAREEAGRCFDCAVNTIFDGEKCILCGGCVDVCPERCLRIVPVDWLPSRDLVGEAVEAQLGHFPRGEASAILKDETKCIRCALCAERCPSGAITIERFCFAVTQGC